MDHCFTRSSERRQAISQGSSPRSFGKQPHAVRCSGSSSGLPFGSSSKGISSGYRRESGTVYSLTFFDKRGDIPEGAPPLPPTASPNIDAQCGHGLRSDSRTATVCYLSAYVAWIRARALGSRLDDESEGRYASEQMRDTSCPASDPMARHLVR